MEQNAVSLQTNQSSSDKLLVVHDLFDTVNQQRKEHQRAPIDFPSLIFEPSPETQEQTKTHESILTDDQLKLEPDALSVLYELGKNQERNDLLSLYEKMLPLNSPQNIEIVSRRFCRENQLRVLDSFESVFKVLEALLSLQSKCYGDVVKGLQTALKGFEKDGETAYSFSHKTEILLKNKIELLCWFKQAETGKVDVDEQIRILKDCLGKEVKVDFSRSLQGELQIWDKDRLVMNGQQIQDSVLSCETAIQTDQNLSQNKEVVQSFFSAKKAFEQFRTVQELLSELREMKFPWDTLQQSHIVNLCDAKNEDLETMKQQWEETCNVGDMRLWMTLAQLGWIEKTFKKKDCQDSADDIEQMVSLFCGVDKRKIRECIDEAMRCEQGGVDTFFTNLSSPNSKEENGILVQRHARLFKMKEDLPEKFFWNKMLEIDQRGNHKRLPSLVFECSQSTNIHELKHFIQRANVFGTKHQFFMLHVERLRHLVKERLMDEIVKGNAKFIMMMKGNDPIEELFQVVEEISGTPKNPTEVPPLCVYSGESTGFLIDVVSGRASSKKTCYIKQKIITEANIEKCLVVPVHEGFSLDRLEKHLPTKCFVHFKVTPFGDLGVFNEFLRVLLLSGMIYDKEKGSCKHISHPEGTKLVFELEQGDNNDVVFDIDFIPSLCFLEPTGRAESESSQSMCSSVRSVNHSLSDESKMSMNASQRFPERWIYDKGPIQEVSVRTPMNVVWEALCEAFHIDLNEMNNVVHALEQEGFVMTQTFALRLLYLNKCIETNYPVLLVGDTGSGKSVLVRMFSILLNQSLYSQNQVKLKTFLREHKVPDCESIYEIEELMKRVKIFCEDNKEETRRELFQGFETFLESERKSGFFNPHDLEFEKDASKSEFDGARIDTMISTMKEYAQTHINLCTHINMSTHIILDDLKSIIEEIKKRINQIPQQTMETKKSTESTVNNPRMRFVLFLDDCTSTNLMGVIKELITDHSFNGDPLPKEFVVIGAYNKNDMKDSPERVPYSKLTDGDSFTGNKMMEFYVRPPPLSFQQYERVVPFGMNDYELRYFIGELLKIGLFEEAMKNESFCQREQSIEREKELGIRWLSFAFKMYREMNNYARIHASIHDVVRSVRFMLHFMRNYNLFELDDARERMKTFIPEQRIPRPFELCLLLSVYLCYYLRVPVAQTGVNSLNRSGFFSELWCRLDNELTSGILEYADAIISCVTDKVYTMTEGFRDNGVKAIDLFKENVFALVCSIHARVPVMIVGPPGCSKTLSWNVVKRCFSGSTGGPKLFQNTILHTYSLQCSTQTTEGDVRQILNQMKEDRMNSGTLQNKQVVYVIFLDEASLVDNEEAPLDPLFQQLDDHVISTDSGGHGMMCVLLSNSVPDAAKTSRMVLVAQSSLDNGSINLYSNMNQLKRLCPGFTELVSLLPMSNRAFSKENPKWTRSFYQLRDFVYAARELNGYGERKRDQRVLFNVLCRQFGGMQAHNYVRLVEHLSMRESEPEECAFCDSHAPVWMMREMIRLITNGPHLVPSPGEQGGRRFLLLIDDTECGAALWFVRDLLRGKEEEASSLVECSVTDFPADSQDVVHQGAICAMSTGMQQGKTVLLTHLTPVSAAFFTLLNLETESSRESGREVHYASVAIGPILRSCRVDPRFSVLVHMSRSEMAAAPAALLNRFQKMLFTFDDLFLYAQHILQTNAGRPAASRALASARECRARCEALVRECGEFSFFGFVRTSTVASILFAALTTDGQFRCARPYDAGPSIPGEPLGAANVRNALETLLLVARPDLLRFSALEPSLRRAYEAQVHTSVVALLQHLRARGGAAGVRWCVFAEKGLYQDSVKEFEAALKGAALDVAVVTLLCASRKDFEKQVADAFEQKGKSASDGATGDDGNKDNNRVRFVVCLADMERMSAHRVVYARSVLDAWARRAGAGGPSVVLVQLVTRRRVGVAEARCSAVFTREWRCTFVSCLYSSTGSSGSGHRSGSSRYETESDQEEGGGGGGEDSATAMAKRILSKGMPPGLQPKPDALGWTSVTELARVARLRARVVRHVAARAEVLRLSGARGDHGGGAVARYAGALDAVLAQCRAQARLQTLFLTLVLLETPSAAALAELQGPAAVDAWCCAAAGVLLPLGCSVDEAFAALGCARPRGPLARPAELDEDAWQRIMTRLLRRILALFDDSTVRVWATRAMEDGVSATTYSYVGAATTYSYVGATTTTRSDGCIACSPNPVPTRTRPCVAFTGSHCLALLHLALHAPAALARHADSVETYCRACGLRVPAGDAALSMAALARAAVQHCNHALLRERLGLADVRALRPARTELRALMLRLTVDGRRPDVDALLAAAERAHRLPRLPDAAQQLRLRRAAAAWLRAYLQYLNRLRRVPDGAVVLSPLLASYIYMHLPSTDCCLHPLPP